MSLVDVDRVFLTMRFPRVSGDEPPVEGTPSGQVEFSPRERG